jgi:chorismate--pyruvate lyase
MKHKARRVRGSDTGGWTALPPLALRRGRFAALLMTPGSLTAALRRQGHTTVSLLRQQLAPPGRDEARMLSGRSGAWRMVREVLLYVDGVPWVFAHTLANPAACQLLRRAGRRPLATVLFTDPQVRAGSLHYRRLPLAHPLLQRAAAVLGVDTRLPARRAVFVRGTARLCVTEVFLPPAERP